LRHALKSLFSTVVAALLVSCSGWDQEGYFENSSASDLETFADQGLAIIPEYASCSAVLVSHDLFTTFHREDLARAVIDAGAKLLVAVADDFDGGLSDDSFKRLRSLMGDIAPDALKKHVILVRNRPGFNAPKIWARDWGPICVRDRSGETVLLDFNYRPGSCWRTGDHVPTAIQLSQKTKRASIPILSEGGNLMVNDDGVCLMTRRILDINRWIENDSNYECSARDAITRYFRLYGGCKKIFFFENWTFNANDHVDMWAKFLNNDTILMGRMEAETLIAVADRTDRRTAESMKEYLDARHKEISELLPDCRIIHVPMPAPRGGITRTYTNSLIVNGTAIIPSYRKSKSEYEDAALVEGYESRVAAAYQKAGLKPVFVDSDDLIKKGGAVHCVTMQLADIVRDAG
jgi:agmatine/peptidylarginine deiminase